jgi:nucleoside-diphosphate-sugar epimerase
LKSQLAVKTFVTGGTGFIGSYFINRAMKRGYHLVCSHRAASQPRKNIVQEPEWVKGALCGDFTSTMEGCDTFVHLAACGVSPQIATKDELLKVNVVDSFKLIQSAASAGIKKFLIMGTSDEYGRSGIRYKFIPTDAPLEPTSNYAASKAALFQLLHAFTIENNIKLIYARIFHAYGIGQHEDNLWPSMRTAALSGVDYNLTPGEQVRAFTPVEEVANQLVKLMTFTNVEDGIPLTINIGSERFQTIRNFAEYWWKEWGAKGELRFGTKPYRKNEVMRYVPLIEGFK